MTISWHLLEGRFAVFSGFGFYVDNSNLAIGQACLRLQGVSEGRRIVDVTPTLPACGRDIPWRRGEAADGGLPRVRVETPAPPALGKEPVHRKSTDFRLEPDSMCESGFLFLGLK